MDAQADCVAFIAVVLRASVQHPLLGAPIIKCAVGCIVISPDGSRYLAHVVPDPLA